MQYFADNTILASLLHCAVRDAGISEVCSECATVQSEQRPVHNISEACDSAASASSMT